MIYLLCGEGVNMSLLDRDLMAPARLSGNFSFTGTYSESFGSSALDNKPAKKNVKDEGLFGSQNFGYFCTFDVKIQTNGVS